MPTYLATAETVFFIVISGVILALGTGALLIGIKLYRITRKLEEVAREWRSVSAVAADSARGVAAWIASLPFVSAFRRSPRRRGKAPSDTTS